MKIKKDSREIYNLIKKNKKIFILTSFLDLVFLFAVIWIATAIMLTIFDILRNITAFTYGLQDTALDIEAQAIAFRTLAEDPNFYALYSSLLNNFFYLALVIYLLTLVFQGINFYKTSLIFKKNKFQNYFPRFFVPFTISYIFIVFSFILTTYLASLNSKLVIPLFPQIVINTILFFMIFFAEYFFLINSVKIMKEKTWKSIKSSLRLGVIQFPKYFKIFLIVYFTVVLSGAITYSLLYLNPYLLVVGIVLLLVPSISVARITLFYLVDK